MRRGENTAADIEKHAKQWIETNQAEVDRWLGEARSAATRQLGGHLSNVNTSEPAGAVEAETQASLWDRGSTWASSSRLRPSR